MTWNTVKIRDSLPPHLVNELSRAGQGRAEEALSASASAINHFVTGRMDGRANERERGLARTANKCR